MGNPIDWLAWVYGKWFVSHPWRGYFVVSILSCVVVLLVIGVLWLRALDKYKELLPKSEAVAASDSVPQSVTAPSVGQVEHSSSQDLTAGKKAKPTRPGGDNSPFVGGIVKQGPCSVS